MFLMLLLVVYSIWTALNLILKLDFGLNLLFVKYSSPSRLIKLLFPSYLAMPGSHIYKFKFIYINFSMEFLLI